MKRTELPATIAGDVVVLALILDKGNKTERVLIGTELNIRLYLEGKDDTEVLFDRERPLGSLLLDHDAQNRGWWCAEVFSPLRNALLYPKERKGYEEVASSTLKENLKSDNAISVFVAGRALAHYCPGKTNRRNEQKAEIFERTMLVLTRSFREVLLTDENLAWERIMEGIGQLFRFTMLRTESDLSIWYPWNRCGQECAVAEASLLPLLLYYLRRLQDWGMCFRKCEVCGKFFVAESGHYCLCSTACEQTQNRLNKRAFDERNRDNKPEQMYQKKRDRIRKLLNIFVEHKDTTIEQAEHAEKAYKAFREDAKNKKHSVSTDEEGRAFVDWLYDQEREFEKMYGGKR